ncbi:MAG TPA: hypothetical protein VGM83_14260 [Devosiaceae bacterium]|jgi:hypothetical protein
MADPKMVLMTIVADKPPSLAEAAALLGVVPADLNAAFGVVPVDPAQNLYAVEIDADKVPAQPAKGGPYRGPFSSPRIVPMGTPRNKSSSGDESK